ncbi:MAG: 2-oxoglutarate dehydrogenase complex dihydrolipoyllysine-residue succinyltransferase [Verrucomicrobia bacterium]|nr:2-oxoglutarate dehydrogenase complex dihydrolipoyllysine-residue succinyltransferase [Verrucomicrobiota bacterium]
MKVEIKIPAMGESVAEAIVSNIIKPSGSFVKLDEEILELETDKVNQVLYAPQSGELTLTVKKDDTVKIGQVIGFVDTDAKAPAGAPAAPSAPPPAPEQAPKVPAPPQPSAPSPAPPGESARVMMPEFAASIKEGPKAPPAAKPQAAAPKPSDEKSSRKKMSGLRKVIAARLVEAKNTTAMLTTFNEVDMSAVMEIRAKEKDNFLKKHGVKLGFMSFFVKGVVASLKANPQVNAAIDGDEIITYHTYDIGVAVSTERGLMVPVVKNCDKLNFGGIEKEIEAYSKKAREGTIAVDDLRGGSFTITNGGVFGSLLSTPILNPPQSAILGMHSIVKRAVVVNDEIVIRPMMYIALSYDHRIVDGKEAVLFLVHLKQSLEDPSRLLLDL